MVNKRKQYELAEQVGLIVPTSRHTVSKKANSYPWVDLALEAEGTMCRGLAYVLFDCRLKKVSVWQYVGRGSAGVADLCCVARHGSGWPSDLEAARYLPLLILCGAGYSVMFIICGLFLEWERTQWLADKWIPRGLGQVSFEKIEGRKANKLVPATQGLDGGTT